MLQTSPSPATQHQHLEAWQPSQTPVSTALGGNDIPLVPAAKRLGIIPGFLFHSHVSPGNSVALAPKDIWNLINSHPLIFPPCLGVSLSPPHSILSPGEELLFHNHQSCPSLPSPAVPAHLPRAGATLLTGAPSLTTLPSPPDPLPSPPAAESLPPQNSGCACGLCLTCCCPAYPPANSPPFPRIPSDRFLC